MRAVSTTATTTQRGLTAPVVDTTTSQAYVQVVGADLGSRLAKLEQMMFQMLKTLGKQPVVAEHF